MLRRDRSSVKLVVDDFGTLATRDGIEDDHATASGFSMIAEEKGTAPDVRLMLLMFGIAAVGVQALMLSPLLTDIALTLKVGAREVGLASAAYGIGVAVAALLAAPRLGAWEKRKALRIAFLVMAMGLAICAMSWDWRVLVVGQAVAGLAAGVIIPGTYAFTAEISLPEKRSQALGKVIFGWSVAMVAGVPLAAMLSAWIDWRGIFLVVAGLSFLMALVMGLLPRATALKPAQSTYYRAALSVPGAMIGLGATFCYMIGFIKPIHLSAITCAHCMGPARGLAG